MKRKTPLLVLIVLALFLVLQSVVIVHAYEYKVVTQFGSVVSVYETPGPHLKIPFIQSTQSIPKKKMLYDLSPSDVTTKDKKVMNVDSFIIWEVTDPVRYMSALNASQEKAETRIGNVVYNSLKTVLSATSQEDIISGRDGKLAQTIPHHRGGDEKTGPAGFQQGVGLPANDLGAQQHCSPVHGGRRLQVLPSSELHG